MTDTDGVLVQKRWAEKVNNAIKPEPPEPKQRESLFYQIRLVGVNEDWTLEGGVWTAQGSFISDEGHIETIKVYCPESRYTTPLKGRFHAVWRGRWEVLLAPRYYPTTVYADDNTITVRNGDSSTYIKGNYQAGVGLSLSNYNTFNNTGVIGLTSDGVTASGNVQVVSPLSVSSGGLKLKTPYIYGQVNQDGDALILYLGFDET